MSDLEMCVYRDVAPSESADYIKSGGVENLLTSCLEFLLQTKPAEPRAALADFLYGEHERDRVVEEIVKERVGILGEVDLGALKEEGKAMNEQLDGGQWMRGETDKVLIGGGKM